MKLPAIPGMEDFAGRSFHTARWDYEYTGGGPHEPLTSSTDKTVALIGTGATRHPVRAAAGRVGQARLRLPAHAVGHRRAGQPADRSWTSPGAPAGLAAGPHGQLPGHHAGPARRSGRGGRRLDAPLRRRPTTPLGRGHDRRPSTCDEPRSSTTGSWRRTGVGWRNWWRIRPRRKHSSRTTGTCASDRASTTNTCRPSTTRM